MWLLLVYVVAHGSGVTTKPDLDFDVHVLVSLPLHVGLNDRYAMIYGSNRLD